jgi:arylsulfatase A-like enzyme
MMTGKTVPGHGVYRLYDNLPDDEILFTRRLQQAGYRTALFGKLHVSGRLYEARQQHPNHGFDMYEWCLEPSIHMDSPFNGYVRWLKKESPDFYRRLKTEGRKLLHVPREFHMTHWAAERTIELIRNSGPNKPFFALMSVFDPHNPYRGYPPEMAELIREDKIRDPITEPGTGPEPTAVTHERSRSYLGEFGEFSADELRRMRRDYHATLALFDAEVGRVLEALEEKGAADNTLVIFTSDGGDMLGDHRLFVKGAFFYDPSVRVPLVMRWPGRVPEGERISELVQLQDLAATILSAAGVLSAEVHKQMPESHDLIALTGGKTKKVRDYAICTYRNTGLFSTAMYPDPPIYGTMLRDERYKLNVYLNPPGSKEPIEGQLFDMDTDKNELHNLWNSPEHQGIRLRLTTKLLEWETRQELMLGSRGGDMFPSPSQRLNNRLK